MSRNLVICCDGTNNEFGVENTNVVRLVQTLERDSTTQRLYYDPGVGTLPEAGSITRIGKWFSKAAALAFGVGLTKDVTEAYAYLMQSWEFGDRVFLFGFSRGAYTARVLAGMLHSFGLLPRGAYNLLPYVMRNYQALSRERRPASGERTQSERVTEEFRRTFARPATGHHDDERHFKIHFLGVWDTVSSVGWVWDPVSFRHTAHNPSIATVRHAVSIDERRWFFRQNLIEQAFSEQDFSELWFPGVHSDVGGGYQEKDGGLWRIPFQWILEHAQKAGLQVNDRRKEEVLNRTPPGIKPWADKQHESLSARWWPAEFFPKFSKRRDARTGQWHDSVWPKIGLGRRREIRRGALIHNAALLRLRESTVKLAAGDGRYEPVNISTSFQSRVRSMQTSPEWLQYEA